MPLLWLSLAFLCGILLSHSTSIPILGWYVLFGLALILILPPINRTLSTRISGQLARLPRPIQVKPLTFYLLLILCLSAGAIRFQQVQPKFDSSFIASYNDLGTEYTVTGVVVSPPDVR